jgi:hypothetical protein
MVARKARRSRGQQSVQGSGSQSESAHGVCDSSSQNHWVTWLSHKTRPKARRAETGSGCAEKLRCRRTHGGIAGLASGGHGLQRRRGRAMKECYMTYMPRWGLYHNLSARGSVVFFLARRDSYILTLGFPGKPSFQTASHFLAP